MDPPRTPKPRTASVPTGQSVSDVGPDDIDQPDIGKERIGIDGGQEPSFLLPVLQKALEGHVQA
jgi:hypothetical protein